MTIANSAQPAIDTTTKTGAFTGAEFLESIQDGREIYIYGERVKNVTQHPAFRNSARMVARWYDGFHEKKDQIGVLTDTGSGQLTHPFFLGSRTTEDLVKCQQAIAELQKISFGWMGRSPDYKAAFLGTLGQIPAFMATMPAMPRNGMLVHRSGSTSGITQSSIRLLIAVARSKKCATSSCMWRRRQTRA